MSKIIDATRIAGKSEPYTIDGPEQKALRKVRTVAMMAAASHSAATRDRLALAFTTPFERTSTPAAF